jgi:hypothetical protein
MQRIKQRDFSGSQKTKALEQSKIYMQEQISELKLIKSDVSQRTLILELAKNLSSRQQYRNKEESTAKNDIVDWVVEEAFVKDEYKPS